MAKDKKSFILYSDIIHTVEKLTDSDAGQLLKHLLRYVNDQSPITDNTLVEIAFEPIKQQLKRDLVKFEDVKVKRSEAGKAGANKRWQEIANANKGKQTITKIAVNDNDNDNVNVISKDIYRSFAHLSITNADVEKLLDKYSINEIDDVLDSIENFKGNKKYTSLYLTANKWLSKNKKSTEVEEPKELLLARKLGLC
jgi:(p)ppGpp synthase/HD superfamily hydrolase